MSLGSVTLRWVDTVAVSVGRNNQLAITVGLRTIRPDSIVPLVGGELRYFADGVVAITKPGLAIQVVQPPNGPTPGPHAPRGAPYLTL